MRLAIRADRHAAFGRLRSALVLATTAANVVFWAWPVAPASGVYIDW